MAGLELQDWGTAAGRRSSSNATDSDEAAAAAGGVDLAAGVSVMPLLAGINDSTAAQVLYTRAPAASSSSGSGGSGLSASALMREASSESKDGGGAEWRSARSSSSPPSESSRLAAGGGAAARGQASGAPIVVAHNLHKTYLLGLEGVPALRGVSLSIQRGEFIVILGSSGGGKTSLLNLLGTIDQPTKGELSICGHRITHHTSDEEFAHLRLKKIGFVFQTFNLLPSMTAQENVSLPMILDGRRSAGEIAQRAKELLERVGLADRRDHLPSQLSGGEQQRVTIARAIANRPSLLLLDEPTGDLDTRTSLLILSLLLDLNRRLGLTCLMVTHDTQLKHYAHRVLHMSDGKLARVETIAQEKRKDMEDALERKVAEIRGDTRAEATQPQRKPPTEHRQPTDYPDFLASDEED